MGICPPKRPSYATGLMLTCSLRSAGSEPEDVALSVPFCISGCWFASKCSRDPRKAALLSGSLEAALRNSSWTQELVLSLCGLGGFLIKARISSLAQGFPNRGSRNKL